MPPDSRADALNHWLQQQRPDLPPAQLLGADASFRRYFRSQNAADRVVIMDAPPEREAVLPFITIAELLQALGVRAPRILAADTVQGFVLLEDLGDLTFTRALKQGHAEATLYQAAAATLVHLQHHWHAQPPVHSLPAYDAPLLQRELALFLDWYWPAYAEHPVPESVREHYHTAWDSILAQLPSLPDTLVLRDYHVDNLMLLPEHATRPVQSDCNRSAPPLNFGPHPKPVTTGEGACASTLTQTCAVLDFQDAVIGSPAYDWVSLLEDARRDVSPAVSAAILDDALTTLPWSAADFLQHYRVLGVQRSLKILGIFQRLKQRDGKPEYLRHQPRLWRLVHQGLSYPELEPVREWFARYLDAEGRPCVP